MSNMLGQPFDNVDEFLNAASSSHGRPAPQDWQSEFAGFQESLGHPEVPQFLIGQFHVRFHAA